MVMGQGIEEGERKRGKETAEKWRKEDRDVQLYRRAGRGGAAEEGR